MAASKSRAAIRFEPFMSQGLPGGSEILDRNLLRLKEFSAGITSIVNTLAVAITVTPGGGSTAGGMTFDFGDNEYEANSATGAETWLAERTCPFGDAAAGLFQLSLVAQGLSTAGAGTFHVRVGGTTGLPDGAIVATILVFGGTYHLVTYGPSAVTNPGAADLLKFTGKPSAAGQSAKLTSVAITVR